MDKLTLHVLSGADNCAEQLYRHLMRCADSTLHSASLVFQSRKDYSEIVLEHPKPQAKSSKSKKLWLEAVCNVLADFILEHLEKPFLERIIRKDKRCSEEEARELLNYCKQLMQEDDGANLREEPYGRARRRKLLAQDLGDYLEDAAGRQPMLNLDGFMRFRNPKYSSELRDIIEYATDEYMLDQQYKEFISLLRYFVYIQDSKIPVAHIMHKGGHEFVLLNEQLNPINTDQVDTTFKVEFLDKDYKLEDMIVSALITIAPERIYIHTREPELAVIHTISQIFEDRAEICRYCPLCEPILNETNHKDKLSP